MMKEIKYLIFLIFISLFIFLTIRYYFSDNNKKNSYRSLGDINKKIEIYSKKLPILENDTQNIIEYVEENSSKKKKFNFWKLLNVDE